MVLGQENNQEMHDEKNKSYLCHQDKQDYKQEERKMVILCFFLERHTIKKYAKLYY